MNKKEIIEKIADEAGLTQKDTGKFLDSFVSVVTEALKQKVKILCLWVLDSLWLPKEAQDVLETLEPGRPLIFRQVKL